jgi:hypothetical protein
MFVAAAVLAFVAFVVHHGWRRDRAIVAGRCAFCSHQWHTDRCNGETLDWQGRRRCTCQT